MESPSTEWLDSSPSRCRISGQRSTDSDPRPVDPGPRPKDPSSQPKDYAPVPSEILERKDQSEIKLPAGRNSSSTSSSKNGSGLEQRLKKEMERTAHLRETIRKAKERIARLEYVKRSDRKLNKAFARSTNSVCEGISLKGFTPVERDKRRKKHSQRKISAIEDDTKLDESPTRKPRQVEVLELSVERLSAKTRELQKAVETASLATVLLRSSSASEKASMWEEKLLTTSDRINNLEHMMQNTKDHVSDLEDHLRSGDERASKEQQGVRRAHQRLLDRLGRLETATERLTESNEEQTLRLKSLEDIIKAWEQRHSDEISQKEMKIDVPKLNEMSERLELLEQRVKSYHSCSNEKFQDIRNALRITKENESSMDSKKKDQLTKLEEAAAAITQKLAHLEDSTIQEKEAMGALERSAKSAFARTTTLERAVVIMQEAILDKFLPLLEKLLPLQEMQLKEMAERLDLQGGAYMPRQRYLLESIAPLVVEAQQAIQKATSSTDELVKRRIAHLEDRTNSLEHFLDQTDEDPRWREMKNLPMDEPYCVLEDTVNNLTHRLLQEQNYESTGVKIRQLPSTDSMELCDTLNDSLETLLKLENETKTPERFLNIEDFKKNVSDHFSKPEKGKSEKKVEKIFQRAKQTIPKDKILDDYIHGMFDLSANDILRTPDETSTGIHLTPEGTAESLPPQQVRNKDLLIGSTFDEALEELEEEEEQAIIASAKKTKVTGEMTGISCLHLLENKKEHSHRDKFDVDLTQKLAGKEHLSLDDI